MSDAARRAITIATKDIGSANAFPLWWRFKNLSSIVQCDITPLIEEKAQEIHAAIGGAARPVPDSKCGAVNVMEARAYLKTLAIDPGIQVVVSWASPVCATTRWLTFAKYWNEFCYPSSDNVWITPLDLSWLLYYDHEETLEFYNLKP
jgi:hypothetical protein